MSNNAVSNKMSFSVVVNSTSFQKSINNALRDPERTRRFTASIVSAVSTNPDLQACGASTIVTAALLGESLNLSPSPQLGQYYLVPYNDKKRGKVAQFQLGYKGLIDLAYRSGEVSIIQAHEVYENDDFDYELGMEPRLRHIPARANRGKVICYYAMFKTKDGGYGFDVMSIEDVQAHAKKYSKAYGSGPWQTNFDEMAKKTVLKKVLKYAPLKSDFVRAAAQDESIKTEIDADMYSVPAEEIPYVEVDENGEVMNDEEQKQ